MSIGVWEPNEAGRVELEKLRHWLDVIRSADPDDLQAGLSAEEVHSGARFMKLKESGWQAAEQLDNSEIVNLVRFFTLAEMQLPGWQGNDTSPVIYLVKILRARDAFTPALRRWIKSNTDNRYLPYGPALQAFE